MDQHVAMCDNSVRDWSKPASYTLAVRDEPVSDDDEASVGEPQSKPACTLSQLEFYISEVKHFSLHNTNPRLLHSVMDLEEEAAKCRIKVEQTSITDFML